MKGFWRRGTQHIDEERVKFRNQRKRDLRGFIERGDEQGYIDYIKRYDPNITAERLGSLIELFRAERKKHPNDA